MANKKITDLQLISLITDALSIPGDNGIQTYRATALQFFTYIRGKIFPEPNELSNISLAASVGSSALTIALKTKAAANPSAADLIRISFRNATLTTGTFATVEISAALSIVISSGSTLGQSDGQPSRIWVYLINNAGTAEMAVSHKRFRDDELVSTTAEGGAGAADSATVMYSTTSRSNVACRCIGYIDNTQTTAGTWASAGTQLQVIPMKHKQVTVQKFTSGSGTYYTPAGCTRIRVRAVGGGGGGSGSGTATGTVAGDGGATTFGTTLISCGGGTHGIHGNNTPAAGGTASLGTGPVGVAVDGGAGGCGMISGGANIGFFAGALGPSTAFGAGGASEFANSGAGVAPPANSGAGAAGASLTVGITGSHRTGQAGGAGGYVDAWITDPLSFYAYAVGAAGTAGGAGTNGGPAKAGAAGQIIVEEFYD